MEEKRGRGRPPINDHKVMNHGRQPLIGLHTESLRTRDLLKAYLLGNLYVEIKEGGTILDGEIHLRLYDITKEKKHKKKEVKNVEKRRG